MKKGQPIPDEDDPKGARAAELIERGYIKRAFDILSCSTWFCRDRLCPTCGVERLREHRALVRRARRKMKRAVLVIFSVYTEALSAAALELAYQRLRTAIRALQRCKSFRHVKIGIGRIEAVPTDFNGRLNGRKVWHVHAHVLIDLGDHDLDVKAVRADFRRLTKQPTKQAKRTTKRDRSYFGIEEIRSEKAVERYITKARDVCPLPGARTLEELDQLARFLKGKELLVSWGVKERGKMKRRTPIAKKTRTKVTKAIRTSPPPLEESGEAYDREVEAWHAKDRPRGPVVPARRVIRWVLRQASAGRPASLIAIVRSSSVGARPSPVEVRRA